MISEKLTAFLLFVSAIMFTGSWFSIPIFMWGHIRDQDFSALVQDPAWVPANISLLVATALLLPGTVGLFACLGKGTRDMSGFALVTTQLGIAWYVSIQFYETFLWPAIARQSPEVFEAVGFTPSDPWVFWQLIASGLMWSLGFGLISAKVFRTTRMKWTSAGLALGAILFGIGMALPLRTIGLFVFSASLAVLSSRLWQGGVRDIQRTDK